MQIKFKAIDMKDPSKIIEKIEHAPNEEQLKDMYKMLGYNIEILDILGEPTSNNNILATAPKAGSGIIEDATANFKSPNIPQRKPKTEAVYFTDGAIEFKVEDSIMYKKDWTLVNMDEYRVVKGKIEKLDWVPLQPKETAQPESPKLESVEPVKEEDLDIPVCK